MTNYFSYPTGFLPLYMVYIHSLYPRSFHQLNDRRPSTSSPLGCARPKARCRLTPCTACCVRSHLWGASWCASACRAAVRPVAIRTPSFQFLLRSWRSKRHHWKTGARARLGAMSATKLLPALGGGQCRGGGWHGDCLALPYRRVMTAEKFRYKHKTRAR